LFAAYTVITQYNLTGKKITEHINIKAAAQAIKAQPNHIRSAILSKVFTCKGYYLVPGTGPDRIDIQPILEKQQEKRRKSICRPVSQYDLKGNKISSYQSISEAAKAVGVTNMCIHSALKPGTHRSCRGFIWQYDK
jgi:hypothetical protein